MMRSILVLFIGLLFVPMISAVKLGASNSRIDFNMSVNEENCKRIGIGTDYVGEIVGELKFAKDSLAENSFNDYNLVPDYFKITPKYAKSIIFEKPGNKETNLCLTGKNPGNYRALLIYKTKNSPAAIGIIIKVYIADEKYDKIKIGLLLTPSIFLSLLLILLFKKIN